MLRMWEEQKGRLGGCVFENLAARESFSPWLSLKIPNSPKLLIPPFPLVRLPTVILIQLSLYLYLGIYLSASTRYSSRYSPLIGACSEFVLNLSRTAPALIPWL
ncbi:hypothetical protein BDZ94DRAFT_1243859 [Collybia nuda]|uniref:Uncharacterized protein n=1 Tax=Collybia nuda TaxID=64659 RepID=A0A9P5YKC2_9AGAR|nr:hypothetical protein BDZ94DRAFT_1243859 [Collybia nuda]